MINDIVSCRGAGVPALTKPLRQRDRRPSAGGYVRLIGGESSSWGAGPCQGGGALLSTKEELQWSI